MVMSDPDDLVAWLRTQLDEIESEAEGSDS